MLEQFKEIWEDLPLSNQVSFRTINLCLFLWLGFEKKKVGEKLALRLKRKLLVVPM